MNNEEKLKASEGQLKMHYAKIERIAESNKDLANRIEQFTNTLIENNFCGIFDVDDDVYHNGLGISQSRFSYLNISTADYHYNTYEEFNSSSERKNCFVDGDFIHRTILEKGTVSSKFCDEDIALRLAYMAKPDAIKIRSTKVYKEEIAKLREQGFEPIKKSLFSNAYMLEKVFKDDEYLSSLMDGAVKEKCIYCLCKETGLIRKSKVDILTEFPDYIYMSDLKSTTSLDDDAIDRSCDDYGYYVQSAYYEDIVKDLLGKDVKRNLLIFIRKFAPFEIKIKFIDNACIEIGKRIYKNHLKNLAKCYSEMSFPRNEITISACGIPEYRMAKIITGLEGS